MVEGFTYSKGLFYFRLCCRISDSIYNRKKILLKEVHYGR